MNFNYKALSEIYNQYILNEDVELYIKDSDDYIHVGSIGQEYYDKVLKRYINQGSTSGVEQRKIIEARLTEANGNINNNANIFQNYLSEGNFDLNDANFDACEQRILDMLTKNQSGFVTDIINETFSGATADNKYFNEAWLTAPNAPTFGRAGAGELYLAFFGNGHKPTKGDLAIRDRNIELKGAEGRLYKTNKITDYYDPLARAEIPSLTEFAEVIAKNSGTEKLINDIVTFIKGNSEIFDQLLYEYRYFRDRNKLRPGNIINYIGGIAQLLSYKKEQGFDSFLAFTPGQSVRVSDVYIQFIDMHNINTVEQLYSLILSLPSKFKFSRAKDGAGFQLTVTPK